MLPIGRGRRGVTAGRGPALAKGPFRCDPTIPGGRRDELRRSTYTFRSPDGRTFRVPPGTTVIVGRGELADVSFSHPSISRRHYRLVNTGDACTILSLNHLWPRINGRQTPTEVTALKAGDTIHVVPDFTLTVDVEPDDGDAGDQAAAAPETIQPSGS